MIIEGNVSVKAAILGNKRTVQAVYADEKKKDKDTSFILHRAEERNIPVKYCSREEIEEMSHGKTHGGLIAEAGLRSFQKEEDCFDSERVFVAVVEGVEDPFNLGYIIRTLYSAGCTGLIIRKREWGEAESVILKSSAGAFEYINLVMSEDIPASVRFFKEKGVRCFAAMRRDAISCYEADFRYPLLLAIGGEMRGLSAKTLQEMDQNIYIPYANDFRNALNAAGAAAVLGFEVFRQNESVFRK